MILLNFRLTKKIPSSLTMTYDLELREKNRRVECWYELYIQSVRLYWSSMAKLMLAEEATAHEEDDNDPSGPTFSHCCRR